MIINGIRADNGRQRRARPVAGYAVIGKAGRRVRRRHQMPVVAPGTVPL